MIRALVIDFARAFLIVFVLWWLVACSTPDPTAPVPPRVIIVAPVAPPVVKEAARTQAQVRHYIDRRPGLSSTELIRMLELSQAMQRAVRRVRAHRSAANVRAARAAVDALREFMR